MNTKAFAYGLVLGGVVGAATALFSTPLSGKELRKQIGDTKGEWSRFAQEIKEDALDIKVSVEKATKEGKEIIQELAGDVKIAVDEWQKSIEPNKDAMQQEMQEIRNTIAQLENKLQEKN